MAITTHRKRAAPSDPLDIDDAEDEGEDPGHGGHEQREQHRVPGESPSLAFLDHVSLLMTSRDLIGRSDGGHGVQPVTPPAVSELSAQIDARG